MQLSDLVIPTAVSTPGMRVAHVLRECIARQDPGIPLRNGSGHVSAGSLLRLALL
jgi:hypothetical protein